MGARNGVGSAGASDGARRRASRDLLPRLEQTSQNLDRLFGRPGILGQVAGHQPAHHKVVELIKLDGDRARREVQRSAQRRHDLLGADGRVVGLLDLAAFHECQVLRGEADRPLVEQDDLAGASWHWQPGTFGRRLSDRAWSGSLVTSLVGAGRAAVPR